MSLLKIHEWPAPILETSALPVTKFDAEFQEFVASMHETMDHSRGIGLAANQVGKALQVLTIHIPRLEKPDEDGYVEELKPWMNKRFTFVNPEIINASGRVKYVEGCLSFPDIFESIERYAQITVRAKDEKGNSFEIEADELFAVCLQHEIDHLKGIVFTQKMSRLKATLVMKKLKRNLQASPA